MTTAEYREYLTMKGQIIQPLPEFDYVQASAIFSFFFCFIVGCWLLSKNIGLILEAVKRW